MKLPLRYRTLIDAIDPRADSRSVVFIDDNDERSELSIGDLYYDALRFAKRLLQDGIERGEPVPVVLPTGREFAVAFFGIAIAGGAPAPLGPPAGFGDIENFTHRTIAVANFLGAKRLVTTAGLESFVADGLPNVEIISDLATRDTQVDDDFVLPAISPDDIALIQCTSGSTGTPKGVVLSHAQVLANVHQIGLGVKVARDEVVISWLPLNHDMGLIGSLLFSLYWGFKLVMIAPGNFLRRPANWLRAVSEHRGTLSPAPNFAYAYATARAKDAELEGVNLSSWRVGFCGAEPVAAATMHAFQARFAKFNLPANVVLPCYGLAESCLAVTFHDVSTPLVVETIDRDTMVAEGHAKQIEGSHFSVVSCGKPLPGTSIRVVDASGRILMDGSVGRVQVRGPSVMNGYFEDEERTAATIVDGWLETGDVGYVRDGNLFVTGREKDLIILRGKNFVPSEFEWAAEQVSGVRRGNAVAFGIFSTQTGTEQLALVCETDLHEAGDLHRLRQQVTTHVMARTGIRPDIVHFVSRERLPKTTSGKLQRSKAKQAFMEQRPSQLWRLP